MSTKPAKKSVKKTTAMKPVSMPKRPAPKKRALSAEAERILATTTPEALEKNKQEQAKQFMGKVLGDLSRLNNQVEFLNDRSTNLFNETGDQLEYLYSCLAGLYEHLHIPMPVRQPRLVDVKVELVTAEELTPEDNWEMTVAYHEKPHTVLGHYEVIMGSGTDATIQHIDKLHPLLRQRLIEAIDARREAGQLVNGCTYTVKTMFYHSGPINADSKPVPNGQVPDAEAA